MGNNVFPERLQDEIPGNGMLHRDGLVLGGLPPPVDSTSIPLQINRYPADNSMPYSISHGALAGPDMTSAFGGINDTDADRPSDRYLGFDPGGAPEWAAFLRHPWDGLKAWELGNKAKDLTRKLYPDDPSKPGRRTDDDADAFRHAYWNYTMTKAFGPDEAQSFGNAHEISVPGPVGARYMDLYNNQIGRDLAAIGRGDPIDVIRNAVAKGSTRNSPFK